MSTSTDELIKEINMILSSGFFAFPVAFPPEKAAEYLRKMQADWAPQNDGQATSAVEPPEVVLLQDNLERICKAYTELRAALFPDKLNDTPTHQETLVRAHTLISLHYHTDKGELP